MTDIFLVAGTRPNFMKIAPLVKELSNTSLSFKIIHTGQHYDYNMSDVFFKDLNIPAPDIHLNVGSASHAVQTAKIMIEFEKILLRDPPNLVVVVGDVNSTLACALVAKKLHIKVAHVEAGLRSFDMGMPEEINRILTDQISDVLFVTEKSGLKNLKKEGIASDKVHFVGNVMIDTLVMNLPKVEKIKAIQKYNLKSKEFVLVTIHRPSNVDKKENLLQVFSILNVVKTKIKILFPIHPRTRKNLADFKIYESQKDDNLILIDPVGYAEFLNLMMNCKLLLTDSGGIQEEGSFLKVPVLTLRENTERPITVEKGTNTIVGTDFKKIISLVDEIISDQYKKGNDIEKWDGHASERIIKIIKEFLLT